jgi:hypothetical protein
MTQNRIRNSAQIQDFQSPKQIKNLTGFSSDNINDN